MTESVVPNCEPIGVSTPSPTPTRSRQRPQRRRWFAVLMVLSLTALGGWAWWQDWRERLPIRWTVNRLRHSNPEVRRAAVLELDGRAGGTAEQRERVVAEVRELLSDPDPAVFDRAYALLQKWGDLPSNRDADFSRRALFRKLKEDWWRANETNQLAALRRIVEAVPVLGNGVESLLLQAVGLPDPEQRREAAVGLAYLAERDGVLARDKLRDLLWDRDATVRRVVVGLVVARRDVESVPTLVRLAVGDPDPEMRPLALAALTELDPAAGRAAAVTALRHPETPTATLLAAARLLSRCAGPAEQATLGAIARDGSRPPSVRAAAVAALAQLRARPDELAAVLLAIPVSDTDADAEADVRAAAAWALVRVGGNRALERVREAVAEDRLRERPIWADRAAAVLATAAKSDQPVAASALVALTHPPVGPHTPATLAALAELAPERAVTAARDWLPAAAEAERSAPPEWDDFAATGDEGASRQQLRAELFAAYVLAKCAPTEPTRVPLLLWRRAVAATADSLTPELAAEKFADGSWPRWGVVLALLLEPAHRAVAWSAILSDEDADAATAEYRFRRLSLGPSWAAAHPTAPRYEPWADRATRLAQMEFVRSWWRLHRPRP